jgi:hypothetical protein
MHDKQQKEDIVEIESSQEALNGKISLKSRRSTRRRKIIHTNKKNYKSKK